MERPSSFADLKASSGIKLSFAAGGGATKPGEGAESNVDRTGGDYASGLIKNVILGKVGESRGWGFHVEQSFVDNIAALAGQKKNGLKCRFEHPEWGKRSLGSAIAAIKNVRVEGDVALGDIHILASATKSPLGNLGEYVLELADERPDFLALSITGSIGEYYFYRADKTRKVIDSDGAYEEYIGSDSPLYITLASLDATDVVDEGAITPGGLFAASSNPGRSADPSLSKPSKSVAMSKKRLAFDINATTSDGASIRISTNEAKPTAGSEVYAEDADGNEAAAPDGEHTIADGPLAGWKIVVKDGKIESATEPASDPVQQGEKPAEGGAGSVQLSAGEQAIMSRLEQLDKRLGTLEKTPLAQHTGKAGNDTFAGHGGGAKEVPSHHKIAQEREKLAQSAPLPKLPSLD